MGEVYLATDVGLEGQGTRPVAIKLIRGARAQDSDTYARFVREMHIAEKFDHENIVQVLTHGKTEQQVPFLVMNFIDGGSLLDNLRESPLTASQTLDFGMQICTALMVAHHNGIVHRDIKPSNILLKKERYPRVRWVAKLSDFGLARWVEDPQHSMDRNIGTIGYRSPEQRKGSTVDARSDIYSLGATLFHAITGQIPEGLLVDDDLQEPIRSIIRKSLATKPADRYQTAQEFYQALQRAFQDLRTTSSKSATPTSLPTTQSKTASQSLSIPPTAKPKELQAISQTPNVGSDNGIKIASSDVISPITRPLSPAASDSTFASQPLAVASPFPQEWENSLVQLVEKFDNQLDSISLSFGFLSFFGLVPSYFVFLSYMSTYWGTLLLIHVGLFVALCVGLVSFENRKISEAATRLIEEFPPDSPKGKFALERLPMIQTKGDAGKKLADFLLQQTTQQKTG
ncbi:MAG: hypothetical protein RLY14_3286 [Planctomycetota bacterium]